MTLMTLSIIKQKREKYSEKPGIVPCVKICFLQKKYKSRREKI